MLIRCPACNNPIARDAVLCPRCGYASERNNNESVTIVIFLIFAVILAVWGFSMESGILNSIYRFFVFAGAIGCGLFAFAILVQKALRGL